MVHWSDRTEMEQARQREIQAATIFENTDEAIMLTDPEQLERQFEIREVGEAEGLQLLELRSRKTDSQFERILLGLNENRLKVMIMEDAFGLRTEWVSLSRHGGRCDPRPTPSIPPIRSLWSRSTFHSSTLRDVSEAASVARW